MKREGWTWLRWDEQSASVLCTDERRATCGKIGGCRDQLAHSLPEHVLRVHFAECRRVRVEVVEVKGRR
jgi:hypothetical protein